MKNVLFALLVSLGSTVYMEGVGSDEDEQIIPQRQRKVQPVPNWIPVPDLEIRANYDYVTAHRQAWREAESEFKEKYPKWRVGDVCSPELFEVADRCSVGYLDRLPRDMVQAMKDKGWAATKVNLTPLPGERGKPYCNDPECAYCLKTDPKHITKILQRLKRREHPAVLPEVIPEEKKRIRPRQQRQNQQDANVVACLRRR